VKDQTIRADNAKSTVMAKLEYDKDFGDRLGTKKKENEVLHKQILEYKGDRQMEQKEFENNLKTTMHKKHPFNTKINQQSMENATRVKEKKQRKNNGGTGVDIYNQGYDDEEMGGIDMLDDGRAGADLDSKFEEEHA
jgi:hypothetical protein